jgi:hypothetical protein
VPSASTSEVTVPLDRLARWVENFGARHGTTELSVAGGLVGRATDGSDFVAMPSFSRTYAGPARVQEFVQACAPPPDWGVLLVRKGGFAVARLSGGTTIESKVGQRHVQGRTKAGGQSQQRFARRRDNQARQAYEAAAEHAVRILAGAGVLVVGGEKVAIAEVLKDPRLSGLPVVGEFLTVPDPRRSVLESAIGTACSVRISVTNA